MKAPQTKQEYRFFIKVLGANELIKKAQVDLAKRDSLKDANKWFKKASGVKHYYDLKPEQVVPKVKMDVPLDWVTIPGLRRDITLLFRKIKSTSLLKKKSDELLFNAVTEHLLYKFGLDLRFYEIIAALILRYPQSAILKLFPFSNLRISDTTIHGQLFINIGSRTRLADLKREWKYIQTRRDNSFFGRVESSRNRSKKNLKRDMYINQLREGGMGYLQIMKKVNEKINKKDEKMGYPEVRKANARYQKSK